MLWPVSMPCFIENQDEIPLAYFGESNVGKMKHTYRKGLKNRYGSMMQAIAGIHYNFSLPESFWAALKKEEGGRHTPFFNGYRPQFYFRTTDVTGTAQLPEGVEMVMPGDNVELIIQLIQPVAIEKELRFAIREGGRTVGAGVVTSVVE